MLPTPSEKLVHRVVLISRTFKGCCGRCVAVWWVVGCCCCFCKGLTKVQRVCPHYPTHAKTVSETNSGHHLCVELLPPAEADKRRLPPPTQRRSHHQSNATVELQSCMHCPLPDVSLDSTATAASTSPVTVRKSSVRSAARFIRQLIRLPGRSHLMNTHLG